MQQRDTGRERKSERGEKAEKTGMLGSHHLSLSSRESALRRRCPRHGIFTSARGSARQRLLTDTRGTDLPETEAERELGWRLRMGMPAMVSSKHEHSSSQRGWLSISRLLCSQLVVFLSLSRSSVQALLYNCTLTHPCTHSLSQAIERSKANSLTSYTLSLLSQHPERIASNSPGPRP